tara:strand:+ start:408 stop:1049 length:642 start_codon:yes stop_codon:yes gene_type:complete
MKKYFYKETGMYVDWKQLENLPKIDTFIDIGVGPMGTPDLYELFNESRLLLIDPLDETNEYINKELSSRDVIFHQCGVGKSSGEVTINVEEEIGRSSILDVADINFEGEPVDRRKITIRKLDSITSSEKNLGKMGIKIDTEGYELDIIKGAEKTLQSTEFVLAEVRHNHESFKGVYKLHEFVNEMHKNNFVLSMIVTAKPFIADLVFQPLKSL